MMANITIEIPDVLIDELERIAARQYRTYEGQIQYYIVESIIRDMPGVTIIYNSNGEIIGIKQIKTVN
jgi:hypothetical protein